MQQEIRTAKYIGWDKKETQMKNAIKVNARHSKNKQLCQKKNNKSFEKKAKKQQR